MNYSYPGACYANGAVRAIVEPNQPLPVNNGVGDQNPDRTVTALKTTPDCVVGLRTRKPEDSGIPAGQAPF